MSYQIHRFGSLYIDGEALPEHGKRQKKRLWSLLWRKRFALGDSVLNKAITWVRPDGMGILVAKQTLLLETSWNDLERAGYVPDGIEVKIDGRDYLCRLLKAGAATDKDEWAEVLKRTPNLDSFWGCGETGFWTNKLWNAQNGIYHSTANGGARQVASRECRYETIGFRPILEPKMPITFGSGSVLTLEGHRFGLRQETVPEAGKDVVSFQPVLYPILNGSPIQSIDPQVFPGVTELKAYTLLMDGKPVRQDLKHGQGYKPGAVLELTDQFFGEKYLIQWHVQGCHAEAARCVLRNVPYQSLVDQGLAAPVKKE